MRVAVPSRLLILIVVGVTLSAPIVQWIAPRNGLIFSDSFARSSMVEVTGLREPADSLLLASWLLASAILVAILMHRTCRLSRWLSLEPTRLELLLGITSTVILGLQIFLPLPVGQQVNIGPTPWWSAALVTLIFAANRAHPLTNHAVIRKLIVLTCGVILTALMLQTPFSVADPYHFSFVGNELLAVAAGEIPLGGVVHTYSNILPFLAAPLVLLLPADPVRVILILVLFLQLLVLAVAGHAIHKSVKSVSIRVVSYLLLASASVALHPYVPTFPVRYWFPFACFLAFSRRSVLRLPSHLMTKRTFLVGFASVFLIINNADFGAAGAGALTLFTIVQNFSAERNFRGWLSFARQWFSGGLIGLFLMMGILYACGTKPALRDLLILPSLFTTGGYFREPMALFEPSVILIVSAMNGLAYTTFLLSRGKQGRDRDVYWLFVMSCFVVLSSSYPMGRSFQSTFTSLAIPSVVVVAILLDHLVLAMKERQSCIGVRSTEASILSIQTIAAVAILGGFFLFGQAIGTLSHASVSVWWMQSSEMHVVESELRADGVSLDELRSSGVGGLTDFRETAFGGQALVWSNYLDLEFDAESVAVSSHPEITALSKELSLRQCSQIQHLGRPVMLDALFYDQLILATSCRGTGEAIVRDWASNDP